MKSATLTLIVIAAALAPASAFAQVEDLNAVFQTARAAAAAHAATPAAVEAPRGTSTPTASSCEDAKELETPLELTVTYPDGRAALHLRFEYAGCDWAPRNDYLPPYTERSYRSKDGYGLTILTDDGQASSEVLLSKGTDWAGNFGALSNSAIVSGDPVRAELTDHEDYRKKAGVAELRNAAKPRAAAADQGTALRCRSVDGRSDLTATISADRRTLENSWSGRAALLDPAKPFVDERCGTARLPLAEVLNFEVTPAHVWGQDILQLRPQDLDARSPKFSANLHDCSYDGDWSDSRDVELTCELTLTPVP